jgi:hypothetical protein
MVRCESFRADVPLKGEIRAGLMHMEIGDVLFSIRAAGKISHIVHEYEPAYQSFFRKADKGGNRETIKVNVRLESGKMPDIKKLTKIFDSGQSWAMYQAGEVYWIALQPPIYERPLWVARFDRDLTGVTVYCGKKLIGEREGKRVVSNPVRYPLDLLLLMYILAPNQGGVIHAAGVEIKGKGFIFPGRSGAGKSTLSGLFAAPEKPKNLEVLSDERMVVRKVGETFRAYGSPWPGEGAIALNKSMPLAGIFFLHHGRDGGNRIKKIKPPEALDRLLQVTSIPWYDRETMPQLLHFCEELIAAIPCFDLHFTPGTEVVNLMQEFNT